jgi:uncharacterized membrane protein SpoIIM required for sporulation
MNRERFIRSRRADWQQFELLLGRLKSTSDSRWTGHDVSELSRLYRSLCYDLSLVQSREWGARLEAYLNDLVAQGHNCLYRSPPASAVRALDFIIYGFPKLLRSRRQEFAISAALFVIPLVICIVVAIVRPDLAATVAGEEQLRAVVDVYSGDVFGQAAGTYGSQRTYMFGYYVSNNTGIAFRAYTFGILAGIGTCLILLSNGITIGMSTGAVLSAGPPASINYTSFVVTHGAPELTAIVVAGAAGLVLAKGIFIPGSRSRLASLRHHGRESLQLALGAGVMLFFAAVLEGYFSPLPIHPAWKYTAGSLAWLFVGLWLGMSGRERAAA